MDIMLLVFMILIVLIGILTSYSDIRYGKIRNRDLFYGLVLGITLMIISLVYFENSFDGKALIVNLLLSFMIGVAFWIMALWTPGDAKLYIVFSFLMSLIIIPEIMPFDYPFMLILLFTFFPMFLFFGVRALLRLRLKGFLKSLKKAFDIKKIAKIMLSFFVFGWIFSILPESMSGFFTRFFILFLVHMFVEKYYGKNYLIFFGIIAVGRIIFDEGIRYGEFLLSFGLMVFMMVILRHVFVDMSFQSFSKHVRLKDLKIGYVPAEMIVKVSDREVEKDAEKRVYRKIEMPMFGMAKKKYEESEILIAQKPEGLNKKDLNLIKKHQKNFSFETLRVYEMLPFAPFMFLGVILAIVFFLF